MGPLNDLTVLELGVLIAGPFCGQLLGDFGADVIKIEQPGVGDPIRQWGEVLVDGHSVFSAKIGRNKKCITLDLRQPAGQDLLKDLVAQADILVENFRPGTMEKWGVGYDVLSQINPRLIMVRVSGFGQDGPYAKRAGFGSIGEAIGGLRYITGDPANLPARTGISIGDSLAATFAALGTLVAVHHRHRTGRGQVVDSAIYESVLAMMESLVPEYTLGGHIRERTGSILPKVAPSNVYPCLDGMMLIAANQDTVFGRLAEAMAQPELANDDRFSNHLARGDNQTELDQVISDWTANLTTHDLQALCDEHGVPCSPIFRAPDMLSDPHFQAREALIDVDHPHLGAFPMQNVFPRLSETPGEISHPAPDLGANNEEIFGQLLDKSAEEIATLKRRGVI
jgi:crotonobetainyl-CoA:carnitine CoA-transferase CaiB-like acyl-CoA transferase